MVNPDPLTSADSTAYMTYFLPLLSSRSRTCRRNGLSNFEFLTIFYCNKRRPRHHLTLLLPSYLYRRSRPPGNAITKIAQEKAGQGRPFVLGNQSHSEVTEAVSSIVSRPAHLSTPFPSIQGGKGIAPLPFSLSPFRHLRPQPVYHVSSNTERAPNSITSAPRSLPSTSSSVRLPFKYSHPC